MSQTATAKLRQPRPVYVEVEVDPYDLEHAGWVYVGKGGDPDGAGVPDATVLDAVTRWHDREHDGPWRWCRHPLCDELRGRDGMTS